jgi:hypothetical protein
VEKITFCLQEQEVELRRFRSALSDHTIMAVIEDEVEHGPVIEQQNEKVMQDGLAYSQVESLSPEVPKEDVVTAKTWLVVMVNMPYHTVMQYHKQKLMRPSRSPLTTPSHIHSCQAWQSPKARLLRSSARPTNRLGLPRSIALPGLWPS